MKQDTPPASSPAALARMRRQKQRDTKPELTLRSALHRRGLRFRVDRQLLPDVRRRHDIVFTSARVVVEVRGCYWHACPLHATRPTNNADWWAAKLAANVKRDADTEQRLRDGGWHVVVVWEHEDPETAAALINEVVRRRQQSGRPRSRNTQRA